MSTGRPAEARRPLAPAAGLVRLATRMLPPGDSRGRYRSELVADLSYLDRSHQLIYAGGVWSTAWALRRELTQERTMDDTISIPTRPLACRLNLHHHWHVESTEDGSRYLRCTRCGKDEPYNGHGPLDGSFVPPVG